MKANLLRELGGERVQGAAAIEADAEF
jgi:hypothetical protein